jgi:hypothetical protein
VPRTTLLQTLQDETDLLNTEEISFAASAEPFEFTRIDI